MNYLACGLDVLVQCFKAFAPFFFSFMIGILMLLVMIFLMLFLHSRWTSCLCLQWATQLKMIFTQKRWTSEVCHPRAIRTCITFTRWEFPQSKTSSRNSKIMLKKHSFQMSLYVPSRIKLSLGSYSWASRPFSL